MTTRTHHTQWSHEMDREYFIEAHFSDSKSARVVEHFLRAAHSTLRQQQDESIGKYTDKVYDFVHIAGYQFGPIDDSIAVRFYICGMLPKFKEIVRSHWPCILDDAAHFALTSDKEPNNDPCLPKQSPAHQDREMIAMPIGIPGLPGPRKGRTRRKHHVHNRNKRGHAPGWRSPKPSMYW